jgi:hypothetical protein
LLDLVRFAFSIPGLNVKDFLDTLHCEDMMVSLYPLFETDSFEQQAQGHKRDIGITSSHKDMLK